MGRARGRSQCSRDRRRRAARRWLRYPRSEDQGDQCPHHADSSHRGGGAETDYRTHDVFSLPPTKNSDCSPVKKSQERRSPRKPSAGSNLRTPLPGRTIAQWEHPSSGRSTFCTLALRNQYRQGPFHPIRSREFAFAESVSRTARESRPAGQFLYPLTGGPEAAPADTRVRTRRGPSARCFHRHSGPGHTTDTGLRAAARPSLRDPGPRRCRAADLTCASRSHSSLFRNCETVPPMHNRPDGNYYREAASSLISVNRPRNDHRIVTPDPGRTEIIIHP